MGEQCLGRRGGVWRTGTDGGDTVIGFDHITLAGQHEERFTIPDDELGLEPAQVAVGPPLLRQFDGGALRKLPSEVFSCVSNFENRVSASATLPQTRRSPPRRTACGSSARHA